MTAANSRWYKSRWRTALKRLTGRTIKRTQYTAETGGAVWFVTPERLQTAENGGLLLEYTSENGMMRLYYRDDHIELLQIRDPSADNQDNPGPMTTGSASMPITDADRQVGLTLEGTWSPQGLTLRRTTVREQELKRAERHEQQRGQSPRS